MKYRVTFEVVLPQWLTISDAEVIEEELRGAGEVEVLDRRHARVVLESTSEWALSKAYYELADTLLGGYSIELPEDPEREEYL
jgi:hypothetical protein